MSIPLTSVEYLHVPLTADVDISSDAMSIGLSESGPWVSATWDAVAGEAKVLIGPGQSLQLAAGVNDIFVRIVDSPESPVLHAGRVVAV